MSFQAQAYEPKAARLLLIEMEKNQFAHNNDDYSHIVACVVRRAVADEPAIEGKRSKVYWDGDAPTGYRNCSWSSHHKNAQYVADMHIRGQIDGLSNPRPLCEGRPYCNKVVYKPYDVESQAASALARTFKAYDAFYDIQYNAREHGGLSTRDEFIDRVALLAHFLNIEQFAFRNTNRYNYNLADSSNFFECHGMAAAKGAILEMLAPYYRPEQQEQHAQID